MLEALYSLVGLYPERGLPDPDSPQFKALPWLSDNQQVWGQEEMRTRYAIAAWVFTNRRSNTTLPPILTQDSHCTWPGVTCSPTDQYGSITQIGPVTELRGKELYLGSKFYMTPELALLSKSLTSLIVQDIGMLPIYN